MGRVELDGLRATLEASPDLVFAADRSGALLYLNATARTRWGDELGRQVVMLVGDALAKAADDVFATGVPSRFEWGEHGPAGVRAWFATAISPLGADAYW